MRCGALPLTGGVKIKLTGGDVYQGLASYSCPAHQCLNGDKLRRCQPMVSGLVVSLRA